MFKKLAIACAFISVVMFCQADVIDIPSDYTTIQEGINASVNGDTVLVQPGTYIENINFNGKNITLGSLFLTAQDTSYISQTVIDGDSLDCVVRFQNGEDSTAVLTGFTIRNGNNYSGAGIFCWNNSSPSLERLIISGNDATSKGGGILCYWTSSPQLKYVEITGNFASDEGGGLCCGNDSSPFLDHVTIYSNVTNGSGGGISCENNSCPLLENVIISSNITNGLGGGIFCDNSSPSLESVTISGNNASYLGGGMHCRDHSSPSLIDVAISDNSSSDKGGGVYCFSYSSPSLVNVTISGNSSNDYGGGMYFYRGISADMVNVIISNNSSSSRGGGIYCDDSNPCLKNVFISGNTAHDYGGGLYCFDSSPILENVTISGNSATGNFDTHGGGICLRGDSSPIFDVADRCNIHSNTIGTIRGAGVDIYSSNNVIIDIIVDTFSVMTPTDYYASPINQFTFDILHSIEDSLVNGDVYVSVDGDDSNSGTSPDEPFKTIRRALSKIYFDSLNVNTIRLAQGVYSDSTNGELYPLNWSNYVNLSGSDQENTILDARNVSGVMEFNNVNNATIENITITNGNAEDGAGIYCIKSSPNLKNLIIKDNYASHGGGGIFCDYHSSPCLEDVILTGNSASRYGGGINCNDLSSPSLTYVNISDNSAGWYGGGLYCCYDSSPILENVIISNNCATEGGAGGGGIFCRSSYPNLMNVTISDNIANMYGGGIYLYNSSPNLQNITIVNNYAPGGSYAQGEGGGIYCYYSSPSLENVTISDNSAGGFGGGIYCGDLSSPSFNTTNRCNIYSNTIENMKGSGVDIYSYIDTIINVIVDTFSVMTPTDYYASPIDQFTFDILHSIEDNLINADVYVSVNGGDSNSGITPDEPFKTIKHALSRLYSDSLNVNTIHLTQGVYNDSTNGELYPLNWSNYVNLLGSDKENTILDARNGSGVMEFDNLDHSKIENITITNGNTRYGGGIYCNNSSPHFENVNISNNSAIGSYVQGEGGGIYCLHSSPILENVIISENYSARYGGGVYCNNSPIHLENVTITDNNSSGEGGGIYCLESSSPSLTNVIISDNSAESYGGGIYCEDSSPNLVNVTISSNIVTEENADAAGGGLYCCSSSPRLVNVTFSSNSAFNRGGGVCCYDNSSPVFEKVTISDNSSQSGGGIYCDNSSPSFAKVTMSSNSASYKGGGIYCYTSFPCLINTIISNNTGEYGIYARHSDPFISYSNFWNNELGNFYGLNDSVGLNVTTNANGDSCDAFYNIQMNPLFVDPTNYDYHLQWGSPCIDAGDPNSPLDPDSTIADMGAYYYDQSMGIDIPGHGDNVFGLMNYPNPFGRSTTIFFSIPVATKVTLQIFNVKGQFVEEILNDDIQSGDTTLEWNSEEYPSGVYFYKLTTPKTSIVNKMVIMK